MLFENHLPRPESVIFCMSPTRPGILRNCGTGAYSFVSLLIIIAVPTPQFGWQPQLTWPQSAPGPCTRSAKSANDPIIESGNQSRVGSVMPTCDFTSLARCESV